MPTGSRRTLAAILLISLSLTLLVYHEVKLLAFENAHNAFMFLFQAVDLKVPAMNTRFGLLDLNASWAPRLLSNWLGAWFAVGSFHGGQPDAADFCWRPAVYCAMWFLLIALVYLAFLRRHALLPILGTFAGVAFGYMPNLADRVCPWDMPALFFYTVFVCLVIRRRLVWILPLLPVAVLFKETAALLPVAFLFGEGPWRRRLKLFAIGMALAGGTKIAANLIAGVGGYSPFNFRLLQVNLDYFMLTDFPHMDWYRLDWAFFNHPIFANAGFLFAFFIAARGCDPHVWMLRTIALIFIAATLMCGVIFEWRIWFELIPIGLYPFYVHDLPKPPGTDAGLRTSPETVA